jgi:hypothetical protein
VGGPQASIKFLFRKTKLEFSASYARTQAQSCRGICAARPETQASLAMRARAPHDDPPRRRPQRYQGPPGTLGHLRSSGVRRLLIYCATGLCHHSATVDADRWPDDTALRGLCPKAVFTRCGMIGADVRPNWQDRSEQESLTGSHWR